MKMRVWAGRVAMALQETFYKVHILRQHNIANGNRSVHYRHRYVSFNSLSLFSSIALSTALSRPG